MKSIFRLKLLGAFTLLLFLFGCGGSGSSGGPGSNQVSFFLTDDLSTGYDHVWINLFEVQIETATGTKTVFQSDLGKAIDVRSLNSGGSQLFQFLGVSDVPNVPIKGFHFITGRDLQLYPTGSTTATAASFTSAFDAGAGRSKFSIKLAPALTVAPGSALTFDFQLQNWNLAGGKVTPVAVMNNGNGLDDLNRHVRSDMSGTVSNLSGTASAMTFQLNGSHGQVVKVRTSSATVIMSEAGERNATLRNGARVEVQGNFARSTREFIARLIRLDDDGESGEDLAKIRGETRGAVESAGPFEVQAARVRGFVPTHLYVQVATNLDTRFFAKIGTPITRADFFAGIAGGGVVEVEGSYNSATNVLTATSAKLEEGTEDEAFPEAKGAVNTVNAGAGTLTLTLTEWRGFNGTVGGSLAVSTNSSTRYRNASGATQTKSEFFSSLSFGDVVKAEGTIAGGSMIAKSLERRAGGGGNDVAELEGLVSSVNPSSRSYTVALVTWFGFTSTVGTPINVTMSEQATYRNDNGASMTKDQFFASLIVGTRVEVEGTVSGTAMIGQKARIERD